MLSVPIEWDRLSMETIRPDDEIENNWFPFQTLLARPMESSPAVALLADNDHSCLLCILTSQIKEFSFVNLDAKCNLLVAPRGFFFSWINQTTAKEEDKILSRAGMAMFVVVSFRWTVSRVLRVLFI